MSGHPSSPEWVIIGFKTDRGVRIVASCSQDVRLGGRVGMHEIHGHILSYVTADGQDFNDAMDALIDVWDPDNIQRSADRQYEAKWLREGDNPQQPDDYIQQVLKTRPKWQRDIFDKMLKPEWKPPTTY